MSRGLGLGSEANAGVLVRFVVPGTCQTHNPRLAAISTMARLSPSPSLAVHDLRRSPDHACDAATPASEGSPMWDAQMRLRAVHVGSYTSREANAATPIREEVGREREGRALREARDLLRWIYHPMRCYADRLSVPGCGSTVRSRMRIDCPLHQTITRTTFAAPPSVLSRTMCPSAPFPAVLLSDLQRKRTVGRRRVHCSGAPFRGGRPAAAQPGGARAQCVGATAAQPCPSQPCTSQPCAAPALACPA